MLPEPAWHLCVSSRGKKLWHYFDRSLVSPICRSNATRVDGAGTFQRFSMLASMTASSCSRCQRVRRPIEDRES